MDFCIFLGVCVPVCYTCVRIFLKGVLLMPPEIFVGAFGAISLIVLVAAVMQWRASFSKRPR